MPSGSPTSAGCPKPRPARKSLDILDNRSDTVYWQGEIPMQPCISPKGEPACCPNHHKNLLPLIQKRRFSSSQVGAVTRNRQPVQDSLLWSKVDSSSFHAPKGPPRLYWFSLSFCQRGCPNLFSSFSCSAPWRGLSGL